MFIVLVHFFIMGIGGFVVIPDDLSWNNTSNAIEKCTVLLTAKPVHLSYEPTHKKNREKTHSDNMSLICIVQVV